MYVCIYKSKESATQPLAPAPIFLPSPALPYTRYVTQGCKLYKKYLSPLSSTTQSLLFVVVFVFVFFLPHLLRSDTMPVSLYFWLAASASPPFFFFFLKTVQFCSVGTLILDCVKLSFFVFLLTSRTRTRTRTRTCALTRSHTRICKSPWEIIRVADFAWYTTFLRRCSSSFVWVLCGGPRSNVFGREQVGIDARTGKRKKMWRKIRWVFWLTIKCSTFGDGLFWLPWKAGCW